MLTSPVAIISAGYYETTGGLTMDSAALRTLEYAKVIDRLVNLVATQRGRELAEALQPSSEYQTVESNLA